MRTRMLAAMLLFLTLAMAACEQANQSADEAARELTGSNMTQQGKAVRQHMHEIERQQQQRFKQLQRQ